jgi:hypothetical protein
MVNGLTQEQNTVLDEAEQLLREAWTDAEFAEEMRTRGYHYCR